MRRPRRRHSLPWVTARAPDTEPLTVLIAPDCFGDSLTAVAMAKSVRNVLIDAGIEIKPMHETMFAS